MAPSRCAGVVATACTQGKRKQHGKPQGVIGDDQPEAREGEAGRPGVAERLAVPRKPGNAGGGKGPQFKTNAASGEGPGDWATYQLRRVFRNCRWRCTRKRRQKPTIAFTFCTTRSAATTSWCGNLAGKFSNFGRFSRRGPLSTMLPGLSLEFPMQASRE